VNAVIILSTQGGMVPTYVEDNQSVEVEKEKVNTTGALFSCLWRNSRW